MFEQLAATLKKNRRTIVFTEGEDARILDAATRLLKEDLLDVLLVGSAPAIRAAAEKGGFDIEGLAILDPATYPGMDEMVELRKGKMSADACRAALKKSN